MIQRFKDFFLNYYFVWQWIVGVAEPNPGMIVHYYNKNGKSKRDFESWKAKNTFYNFFFKHLENASTFKGIWSVTL